MKRFLFSVAISAVAVAAAMLTVPADHISGRDVHNYSSSFSWIKTVDSTIANNATYDTIDTLAGLTGSKIFKFTGLENAKSLYGVIYLEYDSVYGSADSAMDTVGFRIHTAFSGLVDSSKVIWTDSLESGSVNKGAVWFNLTDSIIGDLVWFDFQSVLYDTAAAAHGDTIDYKATVRMKATE